jgi:hypothetical protein
VGNLLAIRIRRDHVHVFDRATGRRLNRADFRAARPVTDRSRYK